MSWITDCAVWDGTVAPPIVWGDFEWDFSLGITSPIVDVIAGENLSWTGSTITGTTLNGLTAANFPGSGSDHHMDTANLGGGHANQPITCVVVAKFDTVNTVLFDRVNSALAFAFFGGTGTWHLNAGTDLSAGTGNTAAHVFWTEFDGASSKVYVDNVSVASGNAGTNGLASQFRFGENRLLTGKFDGIIAHIIVANEIADAPTRTALTAQLAAKWGV